MALRLLFVTSKVDESHDDFAFTILWANAFHEAGYDVSVVTPYKGLVTTNAFPVYSLGSEAGASKLMQVIRFWKYLLTVPHDRAFVHMTSKWLAVGAPYWWIRRIPCYLWFTHYTNPFSLRFGSKIVKRMFAATKECLPHYEGNQKKIIPGHGLDTTFWDVPLLSDHERESKTHLLAVHRISRSKRFDLILQALAKLPAEYMLTHYGQPQDPAHDPAYAEEVSRLVEELNLKNRVIFMGPVPMSKLREVYPHYKAFINMVPKTIDKTVLEAMYCGLTPIITRDHADSIGYPDAPENDDPEVIARFIEQMELKSRDTLRTIIDQRHSLRALIEKMSVYIRPGN